jgi:hypothetical protein
MWSSPCMRASNSHPPANSHPPEGWETRDPPGGIVSFSFIEIFWCFYFSLNDMFLSGWRRYSAWHSQPHQTRRWCLSWFSSLFKSSIVPYFLAPKSRAASHGVDYTFQACWFTIISLGCGVVDGGYAVGWGPSPIWAGKRKRPRNFRL